MISTLSEVENSTVQSVTNQTSSEKQGTLIEETMVGIAQQISDLRKLDYLIRSERFKMIYNATVEADKSIIDEHLRNYDVESIEKWLKARDALSLETMTVTELRQIARRKNVKAYNTLRKDELVDVIKERS